MSCGALPKIAKLAKKKTRGQRATGRSPEWHSHCRYADVMQQYVNGAWSFEQALMGGQLGFTIGTILAILIYESSQCFLPSFESTGLSVQAKKRKIDFQDGCHGGHLGYPIGTILVIFDLQVTSMSPTKFGVNWPFGAGEEATYRFSRSRSWWPSEWF